MLYFKNENGELVNEDNEIITRDLVAGEDFEAIRVGSGGFVAFIEKMGTDMSPVQAARVSYGTGTKTVSDDRTLLRFLTRHKHTSPVEMAEMKFLVQVPMHIWRQWIRHRTASTNEYSTRYSEAIDLCETTAPEEWRGQAKVNKQGSLGGLPRKEITWEGNIGWIGPKREDILPISTDRYYVYYDGRCVYDGISKHEGGWAWPLDYLVVQPNPQYMYLYNNSGKEMYRGMWLTAEQYLTAREATVLEDTRDVYEERLAFGVAKEQARKDLPLSNYTRAYWKIDLHNLRHFLGLRLDEHAQLEIRQFSQAIAYFFKKYFPLIWEAFEDYLDPTKVITLYPLWQKVLETGDTSVLSKGELLEFNAVIAKLKGLTKGI